MTTTVDNIWAWWLEVIERCARQAHHRQIAGLDPSEQFFRIALAVRAMRGDPTAAHLLELDGIAPHLPLPWKESPDE